MDAGAVITVSVDPASDDVGAAVRRALDEKPGVRIVVVAASVSLPALRAALAAGAWGYVVAADSERLLPSAIEAVRAGSLVFPPALRAQFVPAPGLSIRERQILAMLVIGLKNAEIAEKLVVTESTVKSHLSSAYRKLGVTSRAEAAAAILDRDSGFGTEILMIGDAEPD